MTRLWNHAVDTVTWGAVIVAVVVFALWGFERSDDRPALVRRWIYSAALLFVTMLILWMDTPMKYLLFILPLLALAFIWLPTVTSHVMSPLTGTWDGGEDGAKPKPFYFAAEGMRRKGQYAEAIEEVRKQLELFPGDQEGCMKLASIQMENLKDLPAAQATLVEFVQTSGAGPNGIVSALHLLADWQLQYGRSARAATEALQQIVALYPDTAFAHTARQRIAHLGSADETSRVRHESKFTVKQGERGIGLRKESTPEAVPTDPQAQVKEYVRQLEKHPFDTEAREKLAMLYAEEFQRLDLAADQLEQLIALPSEPPKHVAHWLNLLATLHIKHGHNLEAAQAALRRIPERFPGGAQATVAITRLAGLNSELKANQRTPPKTLGAYGKDMGLKQAKG